MGLLSSHPLTELIADYIMSSSTTAVNTFNKSKEDFIWFVKKAVQDKKSYSYSELYHSLLKIFVDADTNRWSGQQGFLLESDRCSCPYAPSLWICTSRFRSIQDRGGQGCCQTKDV